MSGTITIVDDTAVTNEDVQTNFFLSPEDVGKNRGECVAARYNLQLFSGSQLTEIDFRIRLNTSVYFEVEDKF